MIVKMVVVGDGGVGKTSLLIRYTTRRFPKEYISKTPEVYQKELEVNDTSFIFGMFDTLGGNGDDERLRPLCYPDTDYFVMCFSVARVASYERISSYWMPELRRHCPNTPVILVGTKVDIRKDQAAVKKLNDTGVKILTTEDGIRLANEIHASKYMECSAISGDGVDEIFEKTAVEVFIDYLSRKRSTCCCTIL